MERESASQTCPQCRRTFRVLADEVGDWPCPRGCVTEEYEEEAEDDR